MASFSSNSGDGLTPGRVCVVELPPPIGKESSKAAQRLMEVTRRWCKKQPSPRTPNKEMKPRSCKTSTYIAYESHELLQFQVRKMSFNFLMKGENTLRVEVSRGASRDNAPGQICLEFFSPYGRQHWRMADCFISMTIVGRKYSGSTLSKDQLIYI